MSYVAALFVEIDGAYSELPQIDLWDITRDARKYAGPHPVVAHPPCQLWVNFAALNYKRWGGIHNKPGNDLGCFKFALTAVRKYGGILEHPASSNAWTKYNLCKPNELGWVRVTVNEYVCEVWQSAYGHLARKRTWLIYYSPCGNIPFELNWTRLPGTHQIGKFDRIKPTLSGSAASRTPVAFRDQLIALAKWSRKN